MDKRKRRSLLKRFSTRKSNDSTMMRSLNLDTNIVGEEQTFWWRHLEDNTLQPSMMSNRINESSKQLSLNSKLDSSQEDTAEWWKNLNISNSEHNVSVGSIQNFSAAVGDTNVLEKSTSESDKEINVKKRKLRLRSAGRLSESNVFLNVLNSTESDSSLRSRVKEKASYMSDKVSQKNTSIHKNKEDSLDFNSTVNISKSRPSIFKKKKDEWLKDQNTFQNLLTEDDTSNLVKKSHNSSINQHGTPKVADKTIIELPRHSVNRDTNVDEANNINIVDSEIEIGNIPLEISPRTPIAKALANSSRRSATSSGKTLKSRKTLDESIASMKQKIQQNSTLLENERNNKTVNEQVSAHLSLIAENSNRVSVESNGRTSHEQKRLRKSQNNHSTPLTASSRNAFLTISKINSSKTLKTMDNFFKPKESTAAKKQSHDWNLMPLQTFTDTDKIKKVKNALERMKNRERATMKVDVAIGNKESSTSRARAIDNMLKEPRKTRLLVNPPKIDKAFLINGKVYKRPRLPRPKHWATNRLYKFLWKRMEPKYKLATRVQSEKFVQELAKVVAFIQRRKKYDNYKIELENLMKQMARLEIINTRNEFYHFSQDFLPYEFRVKVLPMLLPGNKSIVPYDPNELHAPLLAN
ncbi:hypothetical protein X777_01380 [Ooceraea biroi]|uniref:Uncharacterized protein n=1 Tax=Ooceraea biroi TaxID=2015173 RepID=A0A026WR22_OOCBI|nr:hypothetical protein X777_01380 [Ooceraea biroi]